MLKVIKRKAKEQDAVHPRIDISLVLSEQKMSWDDGSARRNAGISSEDSMLPAVTIASSGISSAGSVGSRDHGAVDEHHHSHSIVRPLSQPKLPSGLFEMQHMDSVGLPPAMDPILPPSMNAPALSTHDALDAEPDSVARPTKKFKSSVDFDGMYLFSLPMCTLLSQEQDKERLKSPLHIFVRKQIEVFTATETELNQPAPGRKRPIQLSQVGIRCIHCKHLPVRERVKRAGSFPSCVSRLYHAVSDFQFDHLPNCTMLPPAVRAEFLTLKDEAKSTKRMDKKRVGKTKGTVSTSTAKYYEEAARSMGMVDGPHGIFISPSFPFAASMDSPLYTFQDLKTESDSSEHCPSSTTEDHAGGNIPFSNTKPSAKPSATVSAPNQQSVFPMPLSASKDSECLNALHVFCRKNIELFSANEEDIASPAPGRKTRPKLGQIGIRCIHCARLPAKDRVKRSVCYPPTVSAIYHATSNMKFDHFKICPALPPDERKEFEVLKNSCARRGSSGNNSTSSASTKPSNSSTSEYYRISALEKGLVDSNSGIRYKDNMDEKVKGNSSEAPRTALSSKGGKGVSVFTGLSALALAACHAK